MHVDIRSTLTDEQFAANKRLQDEMVDTVAMPYFVVVDPKSGQVLRHVGLSGGFGAWEPLLIDFLTGTN